MKKLAEHERQGEKERAREMEKRVRDSVWLDRVTASVVNSAVGQIPESSMTDNPLMQNIIYKMAI